MAVDEMLGPADYIIIMLIAFGMALACRHLFRSFKSGSCPGCGSCGRKPSRRAKKGADLLKDSTVENCCSCSYSKER